MTVTIISPHRDDAIASAGLLILDLVRRRVPVHVINCFTISNYAPFCEDRSADVTMVRRDEDEAIAHRLGDGVHWVDLALTDAPIRLNCSSDVVCDLGPGALRQAEMTDLNARLRSAIPDGSFVVAPLAVGCHIDHILARQAAASIAHAYYEDLPYVADADPSELANLTRGYSPLVTPASCLDEKLVLARRYKSQFSAGDIAAIERHARAVQGERIWRDLTLTSHVGLPSSSYETLQTGSPARTAPPAYEQPVDIKGDGMVAVANQAHDPGRQTNDRAQLANRH
jgi:LmbE family N-acetylglucosaminyl deacetylase